MEGFSAACRGLGDIRTAVAALECAYLLRVNADEHAEAGIAALQVTPEVAIPAPNYQFKFHVNTQ